MSAESLSLAETNKLRLAAGLKPLAAPDQVIENAGPTEDELAASRYDDFQRGLREEKGRADTKARIDKLANQRELKAKRMGKGLGDADAGDGSAKSWAKSFKASAKKRAAELAAQNRQQEQDEADAAATSYSERDLKGLKVGHGVDAFEEGGEHVLTLRDSRIEDDEDDELVNVNMAEDERTKERVELLKTGKSKRQYTGIEGDQPEGLLSKYDEAEAEAGFRLGDDEVVLAAAQAREVEKAAPKTVDRALLNLDYVKNYEVNDYVQEGDAGFKKPKKKKKRAAARAVEEDEDAPAQATSREVLEEQAMRDDEELQLALARQRREKARKRKQERPTYEDDVQVKREEDDDGPGPAGGLVLDDTTEFIRSINAESTLAALQRPEQKPRISTPVEAPVIEEPVEDEMAVDEKPTVDETDALLQPKLEDEYANGPIDEDTVEKEQFVGSSLTATLSMLNQQGLLKKLTPEELERDRQSREHTQWIASRRNDQREREAARLAAKAAGDSRSQQEREADNKARDLEYNKRQMEAMANYKPNVELTYTDEFGRNMSTKEAWKALNHAFHGHGSGAAKTEARLRKIAEERKREAMASGDTPLNLSASFQARQERTGSATMVLSVGNRGSAPMMEGEVGPDLRANPVGSSTSQKSKGKGREEVNLTPMLFAPTQIHHERASTTSERPAVPAQVAVAPAPHKNAGFARVKAESVAPELPRDSPAPVSAPAKPAPGGVKPAPGGIKIAIGSKRRAEGEGDSPAAKRR